MRGNKSYLNCVQRQQAQALWQQKLVKYGFFENPRIETVLSETSLGRVTAASIYAKQSVPHYNGSAMDGIAVCAEDTYGATETSPRHLRLLEKGEQYVPGGCYIVDTGDVIPARTNAVVMIEDVHLDGNTAEVISAAAPWQHVRIIGEDIAANEIVLPEYHKITPVDIAALLSAGIEHIPVVQQPKVAVIPTGDEIVATHAELKPGTILDVNSHMLAAAVTEWGGKPVRMPIVKDKREALKQAVSNCLQEFDVIIINAGTSAGTEDFTSAVLAELGEVIVHGVAIKPGKPVVLAICQGKPVIGLPGYPVSAMLTADLFVREIILAKHKMQVLDEVKTEAVLTKQLVSNIGVEEFIRVSVGNIQGRLVAVPLNRGAGIISSLTKAQGLVRLEQSCAGISAGTVVPVKLLRGNQPINNLLAVGSHDMALEILGSFLRRRAENSSLSCANVGSMAGIMAIRNNEAHIAGIHLLDDKTGIYNLSFAQKLLANRSNTWQLVHLAMRQQGLIVALGNPKNIHSLIDLSRPDVTFVNRQRGSGTRMLLDFELGKMNISPSEIYGYEKEVGTHMAAAASILAGAADAAIGVEAAANALNLDFIPIAQEQYDIILNFESNDQAQDIILEILKSPEFRNEVEALGGYDLSDAGRVITCSKDSQFL
ncbi:molybdopterin biosynthesis protein [Dendrosporobacter sp. 1207_IL3150]|uniref:molybdopterin biosynthesis protein n=1 Tax=Dendrosporobacter sp. 1207_IL3150 TaxID=3084054 RepID=UPI002FDAB5BD